MAAMRDNYRWIAACVLFNSAMYLVLLLSEWLAPEWARLNAQVLAVFGAGCCGIFGAKLLPVARRPS